MIIIKKLISLILKLMFLLFVITFEKVLGLPILFLTVILVFTSKDQGIYNYILLIISSIFIAVVYNLSFALSLLLISYLYIGINNGPLIFKNAVYKYLFYIYSSVLLIAIMTGLFWGRGVIIYFFLSSVAAYLILLNILFSKKNKSISSLGRSFFR